MDEFIPLIGGYLLGEPHLRLLHLSLRKARKRKMSSKKQEEIYKTYQEQRLMRAEPCDPYLLPIQERYLLRQTLAKPRIESLLGNQTTKPRSDSTYLDTLMSTGSMQNKSLKSQNLSSICLRQYSEISLQEKII